MAAMDFRFLDEGLGGAKNKKRKRDAEAENASAAAPQEMETDQPEQQENKRQAVDGGEFKPVYGKPSYDGVIAGKVSGRKWKAIKPTRASALRVSVPGTTLEERNRLKRIANAYKERKKELKEQIRLNKVEKRRRKEEAIKRKEENTKKSGLMLQKITNPKTLKKMSKKERKKLMTVAG